MLIDHLLVDLRLSKSCDIPSVKSDCYSLSVI